MSPCLLLLGSTGCIFGPTCLARQERGTADPISGAVVAGGLAVHRVAYDIRGSQNDVRVSWVNQHLANGPAIRVYVTRTSCVDFVPPGSGTGDCAVIHSAGGPGPNASTLLILTHGRGNPEHLGTPPEYLLWVVGDPEQSVSYAFDVTWFYGPDC